MKLIVDCFLVFFACFFACIGFFFLVLSFLKVVNFGLKALGSFRPATKNGDLAGSGRSRIGF